MTGCGKTVKALKRTSNYRECRPTRLQVEVNMPLVIGGLGVLRRQPLLAAHALTWANRWWHVSQLRRGVLVLLVVGVAVVVALSLREAWRWRVDPADALPAWLLAAGFALWSALLARQRFRGAARRYRCGWMQAWPIQSRQLQRWLGAAGGRAALIVVAWPALMAGLTLSTCAAAVGWNLLACLGGVLTGVGLGRWPRIDADAEAASAGALVSRALQTRGFLGLDQLRGWQRREAGRLSLRRWAIWVVPVLLAAPSTVGVLSAVQIALLVLIWPVYARAMATSLQTITAAARLLAATPLSMRVLWRQLLPRPLALAVMLVVAAGADLLWLGVSPGVIVGVVVLLVLWEVGRVAHCCRRARALRAPGSLMPRAGLS